MKKVLNCLRITSWAEFASKREMALRFERKIDSSLFEKIFDEKEILFLTHF